MAKFLDMIPKELMKKEKLDEVISYIRSLPVSDFVKRDMIVEWCKEVGVKLTKEIVDAVTLGKADYMRG